MRTLEVPYMFLWDPFRVQYLLFLLIAVGYTHGYCCAPPLGETGNAYFNAYEGMGGFWRRTARPT